MNKEDIFKLVVRHSCEVIPELEGHEFKPGDRLADLGANSIDRADIIMMTMETLALQIPRVELYGAQNIGELVDVLYAKLQSS
jgi:polyketide biosynthesis acyl carrier protein